MSAVNPYYCSIDMDLSYNSGNNASPVLAVVNCRDVELGLTWGEADVSNRGSKLELKEPALQVRELTFDMVADETDTNFTAIRAAALAKTPVEFWMANGPIGTSGTVASGGTLNIVYSRCWYKVFGMKRGEPLEGAATVSFTVKPCKITQTNAPVDNSLVA